MDDFIKVKRLGQCFICKPSAKYILIFCRVFRLLNLITCTDNLRIDHAAAVRVECHIVSAKAMRHQTAGTACERVPLFQ